MIFWKQMVWEQGFKQEMALLPRGGGPRFLVGGDHASTLPEAFCHLAESHLWGQ